MKLAIVAITVLFGLGAVEAQAANLQGTLADWNCVKEMVQNGRQKTLKSQPSCRLSPDYSRAAYGLITDDKHFYKLDDAGRAWALKLLKDSPNKDDLEVVVSGTIDGDTVHVTNMSEL